MDRRTSATALGTGAVIVVAAGLGVSIARTGDEGVRPSAGAASASPSVTSSPAPTATPATATATPTAAPAAPSGQRGGSHAGGTGGSHAGGSGGERPHPGHQPPAGATGTLPFTGTPPVPATTALGILLTLAGSWTLVRVPGAPGVSVTVTDAALDRLRTPRRAD